MFYMKNTEYLIDVYRYKGTRQVNGLTAGANILRRGVERAAARLQSRLCGTVDIRP